MNGFYECDYWPKERDSELNVYNSDKSELVAIKTQLASANDCYLLACKF